MSKRITNVKGSKSPKKILAIVAVALVAALIVGVVSIYSLNESGVFHRTKVAMKSEHYTVSSAMMNYFFNTLYQQYSGTYSQMGLDTSKDLRTQQYGQSGTWHDFFMEMTKDNVRQLLVLCEAAKAAGFKLDDSDGHDHSAESLLKEYETYAKMYNVSLNYYLENTFGKGVNAKVFKQCYELSTLASHYSEHMTGSYKFEKADWEKYYLENKDSFNKVDYLTYTFDVDNYKDELGKDATKEQKQAVADRLKVFANELLAVKDRAEYEAYIENYLKTDLYKDKTEEELKKDSIDFKAEVEKCLKEGATNTSSTTDLNKWLFDEKTVAYATKLIEDKDGLGFTVAMILPAENTDLEDDCLYRDTYKLKDFRYIPFTKSSFKDSEKDAKDAADAAFATYKDKPTEDNFIKLSDEYQATSYEGGLVEGVDKGAIGDEVDAWLYDSARKKGDCEVIQVEGSGSYLIYYIGDSDIKWEKQADSALISKQFETEYAALQAKYVVEFMPAGAGLVEAILSTSKK
ncbi:MAG: hypothetical protein IKL24_03650 [Clostridia bacterium]|nr:hypothetical protein [Clostridia bacterium]